MTYIVGFMDYGKDLNVNKDPSHQDLITAYLNSFPSQNEAIDYILRNLKFQKDEFIKDATVIEEITEIETNKDNKE